MADQEKFCFVSMLALELGNNEIALPSLPDVVTRIQSLLEDDCCDFDKIACLVKVDPALVSRLFVFANSAYHNQSGQIVDSLEFAIGRLGFELVRNTALSMAMEQLMFSAGQKAIAPQLRRIWAHSMKLSAMAFALAARHENTNEESAYLCGLFHDVGRLYMLTKAKDFPAFLGNSESLASVLDEWCGPTGMSIVEAWGFPDEVCQSVNPVEYLNKHASSDPTLVDVVYAARLLLDANSNDPQQLQAIPSCVKLGVNADSMPGIKLAFESKLHSSQQSLAATGS